MEIPGVFTSSSKWKLFCFPNVLISFERKHDKRGNCCSRKSRIQTCGIVHKDKIEVGTKVFCYHICDRNTCTSIILPAKYNQPMVYALDKAPIHHIRAPTLGYLHFVKKKRLWSFGKSRHSRIISTEGALRRPLAYHR